MYERKWAMGSCIYTIDVPDISKGIHNHILGQVMDLNCLTWVFDLTLAEQTYLGQSFHPPTLHFHLLRH
jgi:hypothetical protein